MNKEQRNIMKNSKLSNDQSVADTNIDQYCQSVAELLKTINEKSGTRLHQKTPEEPHYEDFTEELFQYIDQDVCN
jgi:hypothetical protein